MVRALLAMNETPEPPDAADALAVALCHLQADQSRRRFGAGAVRTANVPASRASVTRPASATPIQLPRISTLR